MNPAESILKNAKPKTFSDYYSLAKKIGAAEADPAYKKIKIAFLSSFTTKGMKELLFVKSIEQKIHAEIYAGDYGQHAQEILSEQSGLYAFKPQLVFLFVDLQTLMGESFFRPYEMTTDARRKWCVHALGEMRLFAEKLKAGTGAQIVLHDFEVPGASPLGILDNKQAFGFRESVLELNRSLKESFKNDPRVFVFEYDAFCSEIGKQSLRDPKMVAMGDFKLDVNHMPRLCDYYLAYIKAQLGMSKKCIVLDLDNTLWGGVLGEEGIQGIRLGPTPEGRPFWEFQQHLLALFERGIVLAINSRNNPGEVQKVLREHPYMILKEKHFASMQINWNDKATNLQTIAKEINLGADSLVFFDDDKVNREWVEKALPQVVVAPMPEDPALYSSMLLSMNDFNTLQLTEEDKARGEAYATDRLRVELKKEINIEDYLKSLETVVTLEPADSFTIPRIAQLTQKTNQFNMTTRRYLEQDIQGFVSGGKAAVWPFRVKDKFGDLGIIAVAIAEKNGKTWELDSFLMSCRVLGRKIEDTIFAYAAQEAKKAGASVLRGKFIKTEKNVPAQTFYKDHGFRLVSEKDGQVWEYELSKTVEFPAEVRFEVKK